MAMNNENNIIHIISKKNFIVFLISFFVTLLVGLGLLLAKNNQILYDNDLSSFIVFLIVMIVLIIVILIQIRTGMVSIPRRDFAIPIKNPNSIYSLIESWQRIENLSKKLMALNLSKDISAISINSVLDYLSKDLVDKSISREKILEVLKLRNNILHDDQIIKDVDLYKLLQFTYEIIEHLEDRLENNIQDVNTLVVKSAVYGTANKSIDVTEKLNKLVNNNRLEISVSNSLFGDPDFNSKKKLSIIYEIYGKEYNLTSIEGTRLVI